MKHYIIFFITLALSVVFACEDSEEPAPDPAPVVEEPNPTLAAPTITIEQITNQGTVYVGDSLQLQISVSAEGNIAGLQVIDLSGLADVVINTDQVASLLGLNSGTIMVLVLPKAPGTIQLQASVTDQQTPSLTSTATLSLQSQLRNQILIFTNPTDPTFVRVENDTASVVYSGTKDASGVPITLDNVVYRDMQTSEEFIYSFNPDNTPRQAISSSGEVIDFIYANGELIRLLVTTEEGLRVTVPLETSGSTGGRFISKRRSGHLKLHKRSSHQPFYSTARINSSEMLISIDRCGFPLQSNNVSIDLKGDQNILSQTIYGSQVSPGVYGFSIPEPSATLSTDIESYCNGTTGAIEAVCGILSLATIGGRIDPAFVCAAISSALLATPILGDELVVFGACDKMLRALGNICKFVTIGATSGDFIFDEVVDVPSLGWSDACGLLDRFDNVSTSYEVTPQVFVPGVGFEELASFSVDPSTTLPEPSYNIDGATNFVSFTTTPVDPSPGEDYIASAQIECAAPGATGTITIVGTDGFTDSMSFVIDEAFTLIDLEVPGAEGGVRDVITVELSTGEITSISIIF